MRIGARIKQARLHRGLTQKELGTMVGFDEKTADVRIAQYESEARTPKQDMRNKIAEALDINYRYLFSSDSYAAEDIMFLLFELDDAHRLRLTKPDPLEKKVHLYIPYGLVNDFLLDWMKVKDDFIDGLITKKEYDEWKLNWPKSADEYRYRAENGENK